MAASVYTLKVLGIISPFLEQSRKQWSELSVCFVTPVRGGGSDLWGGNSHGKPWVVIRENRFWSRSSAVAESHLCHRTQGWGLRMIYFFWLQKSRVWKLQRTDFRNGVTSQVQVLFARTSSWWGPSAFHEHSTHQALQLWDEQRISRRGAGNPPHHTGPGSAAHTSVPAVSPHPFLRTEVNSAACLGILSGYPNHLKWFGYLV